MKTVTIDKLREGDLYVDGRVPKVLTSLKLSINASVKVPDNWTEFRVGDVVLAEGRQDTVVAIRISSREPQYQLSDGYRYLAESLEIFEPEIVKPGDEILAVSPRDAKQATVIRTEKRQDGLRIWGHWMSPDVETYFLFPSSQISFFKKTDRKYTKL